MSENENHLEIGRCSLCGFGGPIGVEIGAESRRCFRCDLAYDRGRAEERARWIRMCNEQGLRLRDDPAPRETSEGEKCGACLGIGMVDPRHSDKFCFACGGTGKAGG